MTNFDYAVKQTLELEGVFSDDKNDPGGAPATISGSRNGNASRKTAPLGQSRAGESPNYWRGTIASTC